MPISANDINQVYQNMFGSAPDAGTVNSMLQYSNNGSVPLTSFDVQQIFQATPQYQQQQLAQNGNQMQNLLGASDQRILGLSQQALTGQFAQQGRNIGSSGYLGAYANAAANLAMGRQQQMANFYGGGFQNIMQSSTQQGQQAQGYGQNQMASTLGFTRQQQLMAQQLQLQNQMNAANRRRGMFGMAGGALGMGLGGILGGPAGAMMGGQLGSGFGQYAAGSPNYSYGGGGGSGGLYSGGYSPRTGGY